MKNKSGFKVVGGIILLAAVIILGVCFVSQWQNGQKEDAYQDMRQDTDKDGENGTEAVHDFSRLKKQNADIYAWVQVPNTKVDYPVLQSTEDNYYLNHDFNRRESQPGSIYSNACNSTDMEDAITILYGHDMKAHTMFGSLHFFDDKDFFEENDTILVETPEALRTYVIYGVFNYNDDYLPSVFDVKDTEGAAAFIASLEECAAQGDELTHVRQGETLTEDDKILVLSTCISGQDDRRFLVVAKLTNRDGY